MLDRFFRSFALQISITLMAILIGPFSFAENRKSTGSDALLPVIDQYHEALEGKSLSRLSEVVSEDLVVSEGIHVNLTWADFRDNHIGPEMKEWKSFKATDRKRIRAEIKDKMGYVIEELKYEITTLKDEVIRLSAVETFILAKNSKGRWLIEHVHSSAKREPPGGTKSN